MALQPGDDGSAHGLHVNLVPQGHLPCCTCPACNGAFRASTGGSQQLLCAGGSRSPIADSPPSARPAVCVISPAIWPTSGFRSGDTVLVGGEGDDLLVGSPGWDVLSRGMASDTPS